VVVVHNYLSKGFARVDDLAHSRGVGGVGGCLVGRLKEAQQVVGCLVAWDVGGRAHSRRLQSPVRERE
jgi:hypothetical protein